MEMDKEGIECQECDPLRSSALDFFFATMRRGSSLFEVWTIAGDRRLASRRLRLRIHKGPHDSEGCSSEH